MSSEGGAHYNRRPNSMESGVPMQRPNSVESGVPMQRPNSVESGVLMQRPNSVESGVPMQRPNSVESGVPMQPLNSVESGVSMQHPNSVESGVLMQHPLSGNSRASPHRTTPFESAATLNRTTSLDFAIQTGDSKPGSLVADMGSLSKAADMGSLPQIADTGSLPHMADTGSLSQMADILASVGLTPADVVNPWLTNELQRLFPPSFGQGYPSPPRDDLIGEIFELQSGYSLLLNHLRSQHALLQRQSNHSDANIVDGMIRWHLNKLHELDKTKSYLQPSTPMIPATQPSPTSPFDSGAFWFPSTPTSPSSVEQKEPLSPMAPIFVSAPSNPFGGDTFLGMRTSGLTTSGGEGGDRGGAYGGNGGCSGHDVAAGSHGGVAVVRGGGGGNGVGSIRDGGVDVFCSAAPSTSASFNCPSTYAIALSSSLSARGKPPYFPDDTGRARKNFQESNSGSGLHCNFCKNNGEKEAMFKSHGLKDTNGRITCPVLRNYTCPKCGARGDNAHTIKYCPVSAEKARLSTLRVLQLNHRQVASIGGHPYDLQ